MSGIWIYFAIFFGKLVEVAAGTMRSVFINKGNRWMAAAAGLIEVLLWLLVASSVIVGLKEDPFKAVIYCLAFGVGIIVGMLLEQKMAVGLTSIQIVSETKSGEKIGKALRENGFGVTIMEGHSVDGTRREMVFVQLRRRRIQEAIGIAQEICPDALISVSDVRSLRGGFMR